MEAEVREIMSEAIDIGVDTLRIEGDPTKLYEALAKAQAEFAPVPKVDDGQVGNDRRFKYAGYATLMKCVRPALAANGIALIQPLHYRDEMAITTTIIAGHGASIQTSFAFNADYMKTDKYGGKKDDCQEFGRAHTYYRRYQLQSILGIEGDDDADALPDPKERAQFKEPARDAVTGEAVPKQLPAPKAKEAAETKSAPAKEQKTNGSAQPSVASATAQGQPAVDTVENKAKPQSTLNADQLKVLITDCMKQKGWKLIKLREFFAQHVDEAGFEKADTMPIEQMRMLHQKLVQVEGCAPF